MLKNNGLPWFEFIANDWLTSDDVMEMSMAERGVYITLLASQWRCDNELPADAKKIAVLCGTDTRTIANWLAKWGQLFPVVHEAGCQCERNAAGKLTTNKCDEGAAQTSLERSVDVASAQRSCRKRANTKLLNIRKNKELGKSKSPRQDKTKEEKTKLDVDDTTSEVAAAEPPPVSNGFENQLELNNRVQAVVDAWNQLGFASKYTMPKEKTSTYSNMLAFVKEDDWESKVKKLVDAYKKSSFLQSGGTSGTLNSLAWLFNKEWLSHVEEITAGKYNNKKDSKEEEYKTKNTYLADSNEGASDVDLADAGFKML